MGTKHTEKISAIADLIESEVNAPIWAEESARERRMYAIIRELVGMVRGLTVAVEAVIAARQSAGANEAAKETESDDDALRIQNIKLKIAIVSALEILHPLSMATEGALRGRICTASNILDHAVGHPQSVHGEQMGELKNDAD